MRLVAARSSPHVDRLVSVAKAWTPSRGFTQTVPIARVERLGLLAASLVLLFGTTLTYIGQTSEFDEIGESLSAGRVVSLASLPTSASLSGALSVFEQPAERTTVAALLLRRLQAPGVLPLTHVGALASVRIPVADARANEQLVSLKRRLAPGAVASTIALLTPSEVAAIKSGLIVRTPDTYASRVAIALALMLVSFWIAHVVRSSRRVTGDPIVLPVLHMLTGLGFMAMLALRDPLRDTVAAWPFAVGVAVGLFAFTAVAFVDFEDPRLRRSVLMPLIVATILAAALLLFGSGPQGSGAKVNLFGVQPVEGIRLLVVFALAGYFARRWQFLREFSDTVASPGRVARIRLPRWKDVRPLAFTITTLLAFFFLQKDLGPALVISCVFLGLYGMARARSALVLCGSAVLATGFAAGYLLGVPATVAQRVAMWLDPWSNALAGGDQIAHAQWALGTGALLGVGPGMGDPQLIPAGHTDLVVAALGEELGFVGVFVIVALFGLLVWRMLRIALRAPGDYTAFLAAGLCLATVVQGLVIVGAIFGLLPLAGVVTPFMSFGRSSMISNFVAAGVCCAIASRAGAPRELFVKPFRGIGWTLATAGAAIVISAAMVQVVRADAHASRGNLSRQADGGFRYQYNPRLVAAARQITRGTIFDRNGLPLASSRPSELQPFADELRALGISLPTDCSEQRARCYPLGGLVFHVLGESDTQANWAARNTSFVEQEFDARLKGFDDRPRTVTIRDPEGESRAVVTRDYSDLLALARHRGNPNHRAVRAIVNQSRDVRLALDARLQIRVARALESAAAMRAGRGAAIVLDADSGQLLASASYPWPVRAKTPVTTPTEAAAVDRLLDRARFGLYPPGSTFKLITAAAAFRVALAAQQSTFRCVRLDDGRVGGHVDGVNKPVRDDPLDHEPHGTVGLHRALVVSCNAYFAQLAQRVGPQAINETAAAVRINAARPPVDRNLPPTLPHAGYGQGQVVASPLRMARVAAAIASGGVLRDVKVALEPSEPETAVVQWISPRASQELGRYMRDVVTEGTGRSLGSHRGSIAGKTGTAEVDGAASHSWFVGYAPHRGRGRKIAFAVLLENAGYGGRAAAALAGDIVSAAGVNR
jgi:cell division protein FtsW (lipid II flippase)